jgi:beta-lactamase class A
VTRTASWGPAIRKEFRALLPACLALIAAVVGSVILGAHGVSGLALVAYVLGAATLGALSIGHEYGNGTLATLLAQPRSRRDLLVTKLVILTPMLLVFALAAHVVLFDSSGQLRGTGSTPPDWLVAAFALPMLGGLFVAPWLTMACRSTIAGAVFTMTLPGLWWIVGTLVGTWIGAESPEGGGVVALFAGTLATYLAGAVLGWRKFMQLEAIDARGGDVPLPAWLVGRSMVQDRAAMTTTASPLWLLAKKEVRLHQMPIAAAALYVIGWSAILLLGHREPFFVLSLFYSGLISLLIGSLAAAEERQLGTAEWHALLPMATWKQWAAKIAVAAALTWALAVAVPAVAVWIAPPPAVDFLPTLTTATLATLGLMVTGLYVSSLCRSGLWALLISLPVTFGVGTVVGALVNPAVWTRFGVVTTSWWRRVSDWLPAYTFSVRQLDVLRSVTTWLPLVFVVGLAAMALRFGLRNHRSAERGAGRAWRQGASMATYVIVALLLFTGYSMFVSAGVRNRFPEADRKRITEAMQRRARWHNELEQLTRGFDGRVGVCAGDGLIEACLNGEQRFPMQSVWKLPLAIGVLDAVDRGAWKLDERVFVTTKDLSVYVQPMAKLVGPSGFETTIDDLLRRAIVDSDNAAADILLARLGGPTALQLALSRHAVLGIRIARDEKHLQSDINGLEWRPEYVDPAEYGKAVAAVPEATRDQAFQAYLKDQRDTATPRAMTELLERISNADPPIGLSRSSLGRLWQFLNETRSFPDRLKAGVPDGLTIGHKTGTSGDWRGVTAATNDVGIIVGRVGDRFAVISIAVFIAESRAPEKDRAELMANIAKAVIAKY